MPFWKDARFLTNRSQVWDAPSSGNQQMRVSPRDRITLCRTKSNSSNNNNRALISNKNGSLLRSTYSPYFVDEKALRGRNGRNLYPLGRENCRRRYMVPCTQARIGSTHNRFERRSECRSNVLQLRVSCGKIQHGRHNKGSACRAAYQRARLVL